MKSPIRRRGNWVRGYHCGYLRLAGSDSTPPYRRADALCDGVGSRKGALGFTIDGRAVSALNSELRMHRRYLPLVTVALAILGSSLAGSRWPLSGSAIRRRACRVRPMAPSTWRPRRLGSRTASPIFPESGPPRISTARRAAEKRPATATTSHPRATWRTSAPIFRRGCPINRGNCPSSRNAPRTWPSTTRTSVACRISSFARTDCRTC